MVESKKWPVTITTISSHDIISVERVVQKNGDVTSERRIPSNDWYRETYGPIMTPLFKSDASLAVRRHEIHRAFEESMKNAPPRTPFDPNVKCIIRRKGKYYDSAY